MGTLLGLSHACFAQTVPSHAVPGNTAAELQLLASYNGQRVSAVEIAGHPDLQSSQFQDLFAQKEGESFSSDKVEQTAAAIKAQGKFAEVRIQAVPEVSGVRVVLVLEPAFYIGMYEFPGALTFDYSRLIQVADYSVQAPFDAVQVERDRQRLLTFFREQGYFEATIETQLKTDSVHKLVNVDFNTSLGRKARFGDLHFAGVDDAEQRQLRHDLRTLMARLRESAIRPGKTYHYSTLTRARQYLQNKLAKQGHLGAQVHLTGAEYHADTNRADIHFQVAPGQMIKVDIEGAHLWPWTRKNLLPMYQGLSADPETVQEGRQALASYFQKKGYFDATVSENFQKGPNGDTVVYHIRKERKHKVDEVKLTGNTDLKSSQLNPHIAVEKKHWFSHGKFSEQLLRSSVDNLKAVYRAEGFSNAQVVPAVARKDGNIDVTFTVTEGPRDIVNSLTIEGADTFPRSEYASNGLKVVAGQPYSSEHVAADRSTIMANYLKAGYLTASFRETATAASKQESYRINVVYHINEGPKVNTGEVLTVGRANTQQKLIDGDIASIRTGQPLTETELLTAGSKLYDHTGVFDWAEVDPKAPITTQTQDDVLVKVHEGKKNTFTYGFGFEVVQRGGSVPGGTVALPGLPPVGLPPNFTSSQATFYGPRATAEYTRNNVRGKGESLSLTGFAGRLDQRFAAYYIDPSFRWSSWKTTTTISYEKNQENPIFSSQEELASLQFLRFVDRARKNTVFFRYSFSKTDLTRVLLPQLISPSDEHVRLSTLSGNFTRDTRDSPVDEHRGVLDSLELDFNATELGGNVDFAKLTAQAAYFKEKIHHIVWATSLRLGLAQAFSNSRVPISEAFFSGGGNSLRGFPLNSAGPQRQVEVCPNGGTGCNTFIQTPTGGNELLILNFEARIPLTALKQGLGVVPFYDGGNVFPNVGFHNFTSLYSNNVGIGLRYATPVGPLRVDIGHNLNPVPGVKSTNYFISIGQAF